MPLPYRRTPRALEQGRVAFFDVVHLAAAGTLYAALLVTDGRSQPREFVHTSVKVPSGFLWPADLVWARGVAAAAHALFDACESSPDLLICLASLGDPHTLREELGPGVPFARVSPGDADTSDGLEWIGPQPTADMRAPMLIEELAARGLVTEPFSRLRAGLREVYPDAPWAEAESG